MKLPVYLRLLLLLTLIGCAWLLWQDEPAPPDHAAAPVTATPTPTGPAPAAIAETPLAKIDLFPVQTWTPPPAPAPVVNTAPTPPALPFTVSAQWRYENQANIVVLSGNGKQYTLCNRCSVPGRIVPGKMLDAHYRLDKLTDTAVVLTYLPLKQVSTLRLDKH